MTCAADDCDITDDNMRQAHHVAGSCHTILIMDLNLHDICQYSISRMLMQEHCSDHVRISDELICAEDHNQDL